MAPEVFYVWDFLTFSIVQHPASTGAQGFLLTLYMLIEVVIHCSHVNFINFLNLQIFVLLVQRHEFVMTILASVMLDLVAAC